jgi:uncharacterized membrane protein YgcG
MKKFFISIVFALICLQALAQRQPLMVSGQLKDSTGVTVIGASVKLVSTLDTVLTTSDLNGNFTFRNIKSSVFTLSISALGYKAITKSFTLERQRGQQVLTLGNIILATDSRQLGEIVVDGTPDVLVKEDTLQYKADRYKLKENALAEDLLKKLPGVEVDREGNVTAQGKSITRVRVNGKDFFGGDVKTATQQIPADLLENVQIIDDYGDRANITGVRDGEPERILNFTIRPDRNKGYITRGTVGAGNLERYQASVFAANFNNARQISALANLNNTNANIFSLTQGTGGGGGRGGRGGFGGGNADGLTNIRSLGLNFRDEWSKKVTAYGSYSIASRDNNTFNRSFQEILNANTVVQNLDFSNADNGNLSHRFDFNIEYKIDSLNYLKITPRFSYATGDAVDISTFSINNDNTPFSSGRINDFSDSRSPNFSTAILFNHRFRKAQRNLAITADISTNSSLRNQETENFNSLASNPNNEEYQRQLIENDNGNDNLRLGFSYNEPLSKTAGLEFNYEYNYNNIKNNRTVLSTQNQNTTPVVDEDLSNEYEFQFVTNRFGLNYRVREAKYNYSVGMGVQPSVLTGNAITLGTTTRTKVVNIFPSGRFNYKFSRTKELTVNYSGRSNQPSYNQLQPVTDNSNPQFPVTGNPNLEAEFNNTFNVRYNNFNAESGRTFFTNISYNFTQDKIVTNTIRIQNSAIGALQETQYLNTNGFYAVNGFYFFSKAFNDKKYTLGFRGSANYNNQVSFINNQRNIARNTVLSQRLQLQIQPKDWLEIVPAASFSYNVNDNTLNERANAKVNTWSFSFDSKIYFTKTFLIGTQADKNLNSGFNSVSVNPFIINAYLEKQFFKGKTGALRLSAFDLLDENVGVSNTVNSNIRVERESNRLAQYFMLTFTMRINKFAGKNNLEPEMGEGQRRWRSGGGGRPEGSF